MVLPTTTPWSRAGIPRAVGSFSPAPNATATDKKGQGKGDNWKDELARDPWVEEALFVLADMTKKR